MRLRSTARGEAFDLANRHAAARDPASECEASLRIVDGQECAGMAGCDAAFLEQILDWLLELQQANGVGNRGAVFAGALGDLLLRQVKFISQALEGVRLLDRVEIFALEVFDQRHLQRHLLRDIADDDRNAEQAGALRRSPAAFAGDQLEAPGDPADHQRLHDAAGMNRARKLVESFFAEARARLIGARVNQVDIGLKQALRRCRSRCCRCLAADCRSDVAG